MKKNAWRLSTRRVRAIVRIRREGGHSFDCAIAFALRPSRSEDPTRCLCDVAHRQQHRALRVVA